MTTKTWSLARDLKWRQLAWLAGLWLVGSVGATLAIVAETNEIFDNAMAEAANVILAHGDHADMGDGAAEARRMEKLVLAGDRRHYMTYQIRDASGAVLARSSEAPAEGYPAPLKAGYHSRGVMRYLTQAMPGKTTYVQIAEYYDERRDAFLGLIAGFTLPLLALLAAGAFALTRTLARATAPIAALGAELQQRSGANLRAIDGAGMPLELEPVVRDINRLLQRLGDAFEAEKAFTANAAHELRNPIAAAGAQAEYMVRFPDDASNGQRLETLNASLAQLGQRIERLLQLSRAEAGVASSTGGSDLVAVTRLIVTDATRRGRMVSFDPGPEPSQIVVMDADAVGIVVQNLLDNAVVHGRPESLVNVAIDSDATLRVANDCDIVPATELPRLAQRFQRNGGARSGGFGLGLSIVSEIVTQTGGSLTLHSPGRDRVDGFEAVVAFSRPPASADAQP